jgi:hypothetical protein
MRKSSLGGPSRAGGELSTLHGIASSTGRGYKFIRRPGVKAAKIVAWADVETAP